MRGKGHAGLREEFDSGAEVSDLSQPQPIRSDSILGALKEQPVFTRLTQR